jgi:NEDD4-binding protein 2
MILSVQVVFVHGKVKVKQLIIMRGVTGSGKSTKARQIVQEYKTLYDVDGMIFSADDFFMRNGKYEWRGPGVPHAHAWNELRALHAMIAGVELVIIDNTHAQAWEAKGYVQASIHLGYKVEVVEPNTPWAFDAEVLAQKTTHSVPIESIRKYLARWEKDFTVEKILASCAPVR